jgi:hypothetical protein
MDIILYSLSVWFFIYIYKYSDIALPFKRFLEKKTPYYINYMPTCSFCFTFWVTALFFMVDVYSMQYVLVCPVINLFLDLIYNKLKS